MNSQELVNKPIEDIIFYGTQDALREHLTALQFALSNNWENLMEGDMYVNMYKSLDDANMILKKMNKTFEALQGINPKHN